MYLLLIYCCFTNDETIKKNDDINIIDSKDTDNKNNKILNNDNLIDDNVNNNNNDDEKLIKELEKDKSISSYTICNCCGYFYYNAKTNLKGENPCYIKFLYCLKDFFVLNCRSLLDCCDATFCHIFNVILCGKQEICKCNCKCCGCDKNSYNKISEDFCFCYKEKRKYKWCHDYISSQVQRDIIPYVLEYYLLGLIIIFFDKKFANFKVESTKKSIFDGDFSIEDAMNNYEINKKWLIVLFGLYFFYWISGKYGKSKMNKNKEDNSDINYITSFAILNGVHIMLFMNSIISLVFSSLYLINKTDFGDYILLPIIITQYFYFSLNYYCICISDQQDDNEFIFSGKILITVYIKVWNIIYEIIKDNIGDEDYIIIFQIVLSGIIFLTFIYYLICSNSKFKYIICENCMNCNVCEFFQLFLPCCKHNIYCEDGTLFCDCCCCDEDCCCYCNKCESCYTYDCVCLKKEKSTE